MDNTLQPYPEYQDFQLKWLEEIPSHWEVQRAKVVFDEVDKRSETGEEELLTVSSSKGVKPRSEQNVTMFEAETYVGHKLCWPGDLVINSLWAWSKGLGVSQEHGIVSTAYGVYRPKKKYRNHSWYFHHLLRSEVYDWEFNVRSKGIWTSRLQLSDRSFFDMPIVLPPSEEAQEITAFIRTFDSKANRLIRAKERLIELLEEQKQAIIQRAVTRGLDPDVEMKDSGVDWLGEVPAHWEIMPLKYLSHKMQNGATPPTSDRSYYEEGNIPWFGPSSIGSHLEVGSPVRFITEKAIQDGVARKVQSPSLLVTIIGASAGKIALLSEYGATNQQVTAVHLKRSKVFPQYIAFQGKLAEDWLRSNASTATIPIIDSSTLARMPLAVPPLGEQKHISEQVNAEVRQVENTIETARSEIALIREYRTRLIADVVTGKLDVREAEAAQEENGMPIDIKAQQTVPTA